MVCVMPSGFSTRRERNDQNGSPLTFSTMSPAMLKLVLLYWYCEPGSKSSGLVAHSWTTLSAVVGLVHAGIV